MAMRMCGSFMPAGTQARVVAVQPHYSLEYVAKLFEQAEGTRGMQVVLSEGAAATMLHCRNYEQMIRTLDMLSKPKAI